MSRKAAGTKRVEAAASDVIASDADVAFPVEACFDKPILDAGAASIDALLSKASLLGSKIWYIPAY